MFSIRRIIGYATTTTCIIIFLSMHCNQGVLSQEHLQLVDVSESPFEIALQLLLLFDQVADRGRRLFQNSLHVDSLLALQQVLKTLIESFVALRNLRNDERIQVNKTLLLLINDYLLAIDLLLER